MFSNTQRQELIQFHSLLYASALGLTTGMTATMFYSLGTFIPPLQAEFGWSRGHISLAATFLTLAIFCMGTFVGRLCDRYGADRIGAFSLVAYAAAIVAMVFLIEEIYHLWIAFFIIALLGVGSTPIGLMRPITTQFHSARGIAVGIALTGAGIAGFWVPRVVAQMIEAYSWREAYLTLAALAALAAPVVWYGFHRISRRPVEVNATGQTMDGYTPREARRMSTYWVMTVMSFSMALGIAGVVVHMVPLFIDLGASPVEAAGIVSMVGISGVIGRLVVGYLLDHLPTLLVTLSVLVLASAGIFILWAFGLEGGYVAAGLIGIAAGAEVDLIAYLTVSYFGRKHYGAIYGWQYSVFALGFGISPFFVGELHDLFGGYGTPLLACGLLMIVAAFSCLWLPKYSPRQQTPKS